MVFVVDNNNDEKKKKLLISNAQKIKKIEVGNFYLIHDGSLTGHPGYIIWKDDTQNLYLAIKFGSTPSKENKQFFYPLSPEINKSYYYKRLFLGKRKNFGGNTLSRLNIKKEDVTILIQKFDLFAPIYSKNINSKDRHHYKRGIKKSLHNRGQLSDPLGPI